MTFSINNEKFIAAKTPTNEWAVFKCETKHLQGIMTPIAICKGDAELQGVLKRLFLKIVFKPLIRV